MGVKELYVSDGNVVDSTYVFMILEDGTPSLTWYMGNQKVEEKLKKRIQNDIDKYDECISNGINVLYFTYELNKIPNNCFHELILTEEKLKEKITNLIN